MKIEATLSQGRLEFSRPIQLKHDVVRLLVDVPDDEIVESTAAYNVAPEVLMMAASMRSRLDAVRSAPLASDETLPPLSAKTLERIEAFVRREER